MRPMPTRSMPSLSRATPFLRRPAVLLLLAGGVAVAILGVGIVAARLAVGTVGASDPSLEQRSQIAELRFSTLNVTDRNALTAIEIDAGTVAVKLTDGRPDSAVALAGIAGIEGSASALSDNIPAELRRHIGAQARTAASAVHRGDLPGAVSAVRSLQNTLTTLRST